MKAIKPIQSYKLKDKDEITINGKQLREFKYFIVQEILKSMGKKK